jgi:peptide/nickel transport system substrate-binding protein
MASAIDRDSIAKKAELGYVTTASQTLLKLPGQESWLDPKIPNKGMIPYDKAKATQILTSNGYKQQGGKMLGKDGKPIEFKFMVPAGWADWIQAAQIIQRNLSDIGIKMDIETPTPQIHDQRRAAGDFDTLFTVPAGKCSMYQNYSEPLNSAATAAIGQTATSNWIRYKDPATDALLQQLRSTTSEAQQEPIVHQLENVMMTQFPLIPLWYGAVWFEYRTTKAVGWPSEQNPYASPNNTELVLINLRAP